MSVEQFSISIPESELDDLKRRLGDVRFPKNVEKKQWNLGVSGAYLTDTLEYWKNSYDWRNAERQLNDFHHYKTTIANSDIHFIHEKGKAPNSVPIILTHGWPDTFLRYIKLIPMLTDPQQFGIDSGKSFDVVIPSLPGFGFSGYPEDRPVNKETVSDMWLELMTEKLGYQEFMAGGGDMGAGVTMLLAAKYPKNMLGIHLTDVGLVRELLDPTRSNDFSPEEKAYSKSIADWLNNEAGYMKMQSTKPQTLAFGLSDSPVGLAAWILEKFHSWGGTHNSLSQDDIITNIMIYWFMNNISTAARMYYENSRLSRPIGPINVPIGVCFFLEDILLPPRDWVEAHFKPVNWTSVQSGGHFTAMENPEAYAADLFVLLKKLE